MRLYQVSLRTVFELVFVVAVVLAFIYWRAQPVPESSGRYQLTTTATGERGVFFDTKTGKAWRGWLGSNNWQSIPTPVDNSPAVVPGPGPSRMPTAKKSPTAQQTVPAATQGDN
jgi:hypothetical protein